MLTFRPTDLQGVFVVEPELVLDERGSFSRAYCRHEFAEHGLDFAPVQVSLSSNLRRGTLRGLHYQAPPVAEAKLVRCTVGAVFDVAVDLRSDSPTYGSWTAVELTASTGRGIFIPEGCAHGFQTLEDTTELLYLISALYAPDAQRGIRWDDPQLGIDWPDASPRVISERDRSLPHLATSTARERAREIVAPAARSPARRSR